MIAAEGEQKASRALRLDQISEDIFESKIKKTVWGKKKKDKKWSQKSSYHSQRGIRDDR